MAMAGARAAVAQGRQAGHDHRPPLLGLDVLDVQLWILGAWDSEEEKLVAGADVVDGVDGVAEMVGVDPLEAEKLVAGAGMEGFVEGQIFHVNS